MNLPEPTDEQLRELEQSLMSLDDIFAEAKIAKKTPRERLVEAEEASKNLYNNPANWKRGRNIVIVHTPTSSIVGTFAEYTHTKVRNCRKLIGETMEIDALFEIEEITETWAIPVKPIPRQTWHTRRSLVMHAYLPSLFVHAPAISLDVCIGQGKIERIELMHQTLFAQMENCIPQFLTFGAGTNILEVISPVCINRIKEEFRL